METRDPSVPTASRHSGPTTDAAVPGGTTTTGHWDLAGTDRETEPSIAPRTWLRPRLPTTIMLACGEASISDRVALVTKVLPCTVMRRSRCCASSTPSAVTSCAASRAPASRAGRPGLGALAIPG